MDHASAAKPLNGIRKALSKLESRRHADPVRPPTQLTSLPSLLRIIMRHGSGCDEDSEVCTAVQPYSTSQALAFCTPLLLTFLVVGAVAALRVFPRLSRIQGYRDGDYHALPVSAPPPLQPTRSDFGAKSPWRKLAAASFAIAMGLSAVLAELILAEVLGSASTNVRDSALRLTVQTLLFLLIIGRQLEPCPW